MKELSIEEKAKRFDEIMGRAKKELDACGSLDCDAARQIFRLFPELENNDEKIRKAIIEYIKTGTYHKSWIDWLEKQGEQPKKNDVCDNCDQQGSCVSPCPMKLVEKQGEQMPAWSEEDKIGLGNAIWCCRQAASIAKDENDMGNAWYAENWLKSLKDRLQLK